jgi:hypothetical protein
MSQASILRPDEIISSEITFLEGEKASLEKRISDLRDLLSPSGSPIPKAGAATPSSNTSGRTQAPGPVSNAQSIVKTAAAKVIWVKKNESWYWGFVANKDGTAIPANADLLGMIQTSSTGAVTDGEFEYKLGSNPSFLNKAKWKKK